MKTYILDRAKRILVDALRGSATKIVPKSSGGLLSGLAVKAMAAAVVKAAFIGLLIGGAYVGKGYLDAYQAEDIWHQVKEKLASARDGDALKTQERQADAKSFSGYYVVKVDDRNIYSVRSADHFYPDGRTRIPIAYSNFRHGGNSAEAAPLQVLSKRFNSSSEATRAMAQIIGTNQYHSPRLAGGYVASSNGARITIDDWGAVDFGALKFGP